MEYNELTPQQKAISQTIENVYIMHHSVNIKDFIISLAFILNKYKKKRNTNVN